MKTNRNSYKLRADALLTPAAKMDEAKKRARQLLQLVKEAQRLRSKKFYNVEEVMKKSKKWVEKIHKTFILIVVSKRQTVWDKFVIDS